MTGYLSFLENEKNYSKQASNILRTVTEEGIDIFSVLQKAQSEPKWLKTIRKQVNTTGQNV